MLHDLKPVKGAVRKRKRLGRGIGSGTGKTAGKGHKGQKARSGNQPRPGFEGGQTQFFMRIPKRGFNNINRKEYAVVNLTDLNLFEDGDIVTPEVLLEKRIIRKTLSGVKILANGSLEKNITVKANQFSKAAIAAIEKAGGTAEVI